MAKPTRHGPHDMLNIFQDNFFENATPMISHAPMPSTSKPPRRPLQSSDTNVVLNPPIMFPATQSPLKPASQKATNPTTPLKAMQGQQLNMVSFKPPQNPMRPTDCIQKKQPFMSRFKTVAQKPVVEPGLNFPGNENAPRPILYQPGAAMNLSIENYYQKPKGKRLLEPAPIKDSRPQKKPRLEDSPLPPHDSFPAITDDGTKPGHSYATLIGMAILRSPHRRLTLSQIYKWISDTYSFYNPQDAGWQNSIRHNLSLNKAFVKQERPKDDPGKGNYWAIEPGMEHQFMKEKPTRKSAITAENLPVMTTLEPSMPLGPAMQEPALPPQLPVIAPSLPNMQPYHAPAAPLQHEPSSDATIPVSDSAAPEESLEKTVETEAPFDSSLYSPLPAAMHSSPPIPRHIEAHHGTPPPPPRQLGSSITRSHKRKFASMDDSGYISSLESSVLRGNQHAKLLTSEADRPRIKRGRAGRAEEEIARLRASSYDSPSKGRSWNGLGPQSSSPLRQIPQNDAHQMRPPRTPAIKLKALPQPPPSNSPNTNLRIHRDKVQSMLQSPLRRIHNAEDDSNIFFTPNQQKIGDFSLDHHFNVDLGSSNYHGIGFDIHNDDMTSFFHDIESPIKRSAKRMRLDRTQSAGILGEVTNPSARKSVTSAPLLKVPGQSPAIAFDTPSKAFDGLMSSPSKFFAFQSPLKMQSTMDENDENAWNLDDFYSTDLIQDNDECSGLDILQGFEKIGASSQPVRPSTGVSKPALGRSYTTNF